MLLVPFLSFRYLYLILYITSISSNLWPVLDSFIPPNQSLAPDVTRTQCCHRPYIPGPCPLPSLISIITASGVHTYLYIPYLQVGISYESIQSTTWLDFTSIWAYNIFLTPYTLHPTKGAWLPGIPSTYPGYFHNGCTHSYTTVDPHRKPKWQGYIRATTNSGAGTDPSSHSNQGRR